MESNTKFDLVHVTEIKIKSGVKSIFHQKLSLEIGAAQIDVLRTTLVKTFTQLGFKDVTTSYIYQNKFFEDVQQSQKEKDKAL